VSGLEMAQISQRLSWTPKEADEGMKGIVTQCYNVRFFFTPLLFLSHCVVERFTYEPCVCLRTQICLDAGSKQDLTSGDFAIWG
jgi:hypothetical protein